MTCNFPRAPKSKMWCSLGREGYEQVGERESRSATPAHARREATATWRAAGRGRTASRRNTHDGEYLERTARVRRSRCAQTPAAGPALGFGCAAEERIGAVAQGRSAGAGVRHRAVDVASSRAADRGEVWPPIQR